LIFILQIIQNMLVKFQQFIHYHKNEVRYG
jgi:hypothetical protein